MENIKKYFVYSIFAVLAVCIVSAIFIYTKNVKMAEGTDSFNMYYINMNTNTLEIEKRAINSVSDQKLMFNTVVEEYFAGSKNTNLGLSLPKEFKVNDKRYSNSTAYIDLAESYNDMPSNLKILSMGSLVYTLTDLDFINNVCITVAGIPMMDRDNEKIAVFNRDIVMNNPTVNPEKTKWQVVYLYFANQDGSKLVCQQRGMEVKQSQSLEYQIVEQLIAGPDSSNGANLQQTVPSDTKIKDIKTEEGICYVNLSREFMKKKGNVSEPITIYSIVNSLTELGTVNKVQFLIEGEKLNEYNGDLDFSKPFERDTTLIK
ncbi:MAG: GerMN domain-containing protein [Clostridia bacterium]|nr:GerMN domain-containing protein [Clostridia bacterium]